MSSERENSASTMEDDSMTEMIETLENNPDQHAFVMLGEKTLFLSHLTMFHMEDHMYEFILQASLPDEIMQIYLEDKRRHPDSTYFLGNHIHDAMTIPDIHNRHRTGFSADIWRDIPYKKAYTEWPWNGTDPIISQAPLTVERIVSYRHFDFAQEFPSCLTYVLFGAGDEAHLSHCQTKEPDFDHVLSLQQAPDWLPQSQLMAGVHINFPELRSHPPYCSNPLTDSTYQVTYQGKTRRYPVAIGQNYWCSTKVVNMVDPCSD